MKKIFLIITLITGCLSASVYNNDIRLTEFYKSANQVEISWANGTYAHKGFYYLEGMGEIVIGTVIKDNNGILTEGYQYVGYSTYPFKVISGSDKKSYETIVGIKYTVYDHGYFQVFSNDQNQFYILK